MSVGELGLAAALILFFFLVNKIAESVSKKRKEHRENKEAGQKTDPFPARTSMNSPPSGVCEGGRETADSGGAGLNCHDWEKENTRIVAHDSYRMNSPYWVVDQYRCTRCGKTWEGEKYMTMTSPYAEDDDDRDDN